MSKKDETAAVLTDLAPTTAPARPEGTPIPANVIHIPTAAGETIIREDY